MHGQDRRVPYEQSPHFAEALRKVGAPVKMMSINGPMPGKEPEPSYEILDEGIYHLYDKYLKEE
jgi:hypothetical protein